MKSQIFYFSGTGNSLALSKSLSEKLGDAEIISIPVALKRGIKPETDSLGIVYPVYAFGLPMIVAKFLKSLELSPETYIFSVCNYAGWAGKSLQLADSFLRDRGLFLSAGYALKMPGNYIPFGGAPSIEKQHKRFACAEKRLAAIAETVRLRKKVPLEGNFIPPLLLSKLIFKQCAREALSAAKNFWSDSKCDSCGLCAKVCQFENIAVRDGKPVWGNHCEQCMACLQWCPREAIQYNKASVKRRRYHHPEVKPGELFLDRH